MDSNYCKILKQSLDGQRDIDEQTFASAQILSERLQRLKKLDKLFSGVEFSPAVSELLKQKKPLAAAF